MVLEGQIAKALNRALGDRLHGLDKSERETVFTEWRSHAEKRASEIDRFERDIVDQFERESESGIRRGVED